MSAISDWAINQAESLWSREATKARGCTCGGTDIGVGVMHEPTCGDHRPEDVATLLLAAHAAGFRDAATCNGSTPYPLLDVLRILANAADHLHDAHNCDAHGYEVTREATNAAREIIHELTTKLTPEKP